MRGVIGTLTVKNCNDGKSNATGPSTPGGPLCRCTLVTFATLWLHCVRMLVASSDKSTEHVPAACDFVDGTSCPPIMGNDSDSSRRRRICPRTAPVGRPLVWMLI